MMKNGVEQIRVEKANKPVLLYNLRGNRVNYSEQKYEYDSADDSNDEEYEEKEEQEDEESDEESDEEISAEEISHRAKVYRRKMNWAMPNSAAARSVPDGLILRSSDLPNALSGIFTLQEVKKDTIYGPYVGLIVFDREDSYRNGYGWEVRSCMILFYTHI